MKRGRRKRVKKTGKKKGKIKGKIQVKRYGEHIPKGQN
jgi:hypothetical protein